MMKIGWINLLNKSDILMRSPGKKENLGLQAVI